MSPGPSYAPVWAGHALLRELLPWLGLVLLAAWTARPTPWWLVGAALAAVGTALTAEGKDRARSGALVLLLTAVVVGFLAHHRVALLADFENYWSRREAAVARVLEGELEQLLATGESTAQELTGVLSVREGEARHRWVSRLRTRHDFTAVAAYDSAGRLLVWDGTHQGTVPDRVRAGTVPYAYADRPLFSHLYFTELLPGGRGTAMVAALLRSDIPAALDAETGDFTSRIRARTG